MKLNVQESKETKLFKSYISQKFFNAINSLVPKGEVKDFWVDTSLYPFIFFIPDIIETIKSEKTLQVVFLDSLNPQGYQFNTSRILVLVSGDPPSLRRAFAKLEGVIEKANKEHKVLVYFWIVLGCFMF